MNRSDLSQHTSGHTFSIGRRGQFVAAVIALLALAVLAVATPHASAAISDEEELSQLGSFGSAAGQLEGPGGVATDPVTGHVYVAEEDESSRISEFTPWGNFVKAFGWDVAPGAVNEQQEVRVRAASGQFKLTFGVGPSTTTTDLAFDAPGSESEGPGSVEAALNSLASIGGAGGEVSVEAVPGTPDGKTPSIYVVAFKGSLAGSDVAQLTATNGTTPLGGGIPLSTLEARTRADGTPGGTGLESCTAESGCKAGRRGPGPGELDRPRGATVDANGNVYIKEVDSHRVQKFDSAGRFVWMAGGEVNKTKSAELGSSEAERNLCTKASGDECGIGIDGNAPGQVNGNGAGIALCSGTLFVAGKGAIQRFNPEGEFAAPLAVVPGNTVSKIACNPVSGGLYATFENDDQDVRKLNATTGEEVGKVEVKNVGAIATESAGGLFANAQITGKNEGILEFDAGGKPLSPPRCCEAAGLLRIGGLGTNAAGNLYVTYTTQTDSLVRVFGPAPVIYEAAPQVPPSIVGQFATSVDRDGATVGAEINPHFWSNTRYYVEYGTGKCFEGGCETTKPVPPGEILTSKVTDATVRSAGIFLEGLKRGTTYHYRFVAESSGGGPVRGIGGDMGVDGEESALTTYPAAVSLKTDCPNQTFRAGFSAPLPDCRAFEMVSPVDKNNGDIKTLLDVPGFYTSLSQSALDGSRFTYSSARSFGAPQGAPFANQYIAARNDGIGWSSEAINPAEISHLSTNALENHYRAFSADLCQGWLLSEANPALVPSVADGSLEFYRRDNCNGGGYKAVLLVKNTVSAYFPVLQGSAVDGKKALVLAKDKLTAEAASNRWQEYYASDGELHLICIGPSGSPSGGNCSGGTSGASTIAVPGFPELERFSSLRNAISADGSKVYWTDSGATESGPGKVYVRLNPGEEQSEVSGGKCTEPEKACTLEVSETVTSKASRFLGASPDGSKALFVVTEGAQAGNFYEFDLESQSSTLTAGKALGVAGMSEDLSRVYFVSEEVLPEISGAAAGKPNLYLDQEGTKTFIATISKEDAVARIPSTAPFESVFHAARATPDGRVLTFISTESPTGYDNTDVVNGKADSEVYLYEAGSPAPVCVSCNPSGARPVGRVVQGAANSPAKLPTAGSLTTPENALYSPRVLSSDGSRLFFNSFDALLPRDTNGKGDVYEWEAASGTKDCAEKGAELYVPSSVGCLSLISSGESPSDSEFLDASADGGDAFFTTDTSLLLQDPGLIDVYDARVDGGLPAPPAPPGPCQGEACQFAPPPPNDPTPASASFKGAGNLKPSTRCAKNKVARKGRCVAKKRKQAKKRHGKRNANADRSQGR